MRYDVECMFGISNNVIAITGGGSGIGRGLCEALSELGAEIAVLDLDREKAEMTAEAIRKKGGMALAVPVDVTDYSGVEDAFTRIVGHFGKINGLVNCAGISHVEALNTMSMEKFKAVMDVNFMGTVNCTKAAGKYMLASGSGRIVNISSLAGNVGKPNYTAYTSSKGAVNAFTKCMAIEWSRRDINVNAIAPVIVETEINRKQIAENPGYLERVISTIPQGKSCQLEYLVGVVAFLMAPASSYITGQIIYCDGGCSAGDIRVIKPE